MKKTIIIVLIFIFVCSLVCSEEVYQEIEINELLDNFFPNYEIENRFSIEGIGQGFAVAKDTGEILNITKIDNKIKIFLFNKDAEKQWERVITESGYGLSYEISDNGSAIVITNYAKENGINFVFDREGNKLFEKKLKDIQLKPTPNGQFFFEEIGQMANRNNGLYIYNRSGESIPLSGFNFKSQKHIRLKFINNEEFFVYMNNELAFFNFKDGFISQKWSYQLAEGDNLYDHFKNHVQFNDKYILISTIYLTKEGSYLESTIFSLNGKVVFTDSIFYNVARFIDTDKIVAFSRTNKGTFLKFVDLLNNTTIFIKDIPQFEKRNADNPFTEVMFVDNITFYKVSRFPSDKYKFSTLLIKSDDVNQYISEYSFKKFTNKIIAFKQFIENTELVLLKRK